MRKVVTVEMQGQLQWLTRQVASGRWIGTCDAMGLAMEADSLDELHSLIDETLQLVLIDLLEDDEFERYLQEHGWTARNLPSHPTDEVEFDVPWQLLVEGARRDSDRRTG